jgi:hypothetical protein
MNSPSNSTFRDNITNNKQSSISILNNSLVNKSVDSNGNSSNSYINNIKTNNFSNSFSTLSLNFQTKAINRTDIVSYNLKRPELDIEELYDKEMESYLSHVKKEETKTTDADTFSGNNLETNNNVTEMSNIKDANNPKLIAVGKEFNTSNSAAVNKPKPKAVSQTSKSLAKSIATITQTKETPKKVEAAKPETTANIKKIAPVPSTGQSSAAKKVAPSGNVISSSNSNANTANIKTNKREILASVEKNKAVLNTTEYSTKSKNSENTSKLSSAQKVANIIINTQTLNAEKLEIKNFSFNAKESARTDSVLRNAVNAINDKNFKTKAEVPRNKYASVTKKK